MGSYCVYIHTSPSGKKTEGMVDKHILRRLRGEFLKVVLGFTVESQDFSF